MPNPNPKQTEGFKKQQYKLVGEELPPGEKLSRKSIGIKFPESIDTWLRSLPVAERGAWLRKVVWEAAQKEESFKARKD